MVCLFLGVEVKAGNAPIFNAVGPLKTHSGTVLNYEQLLLSVSSFTLYDYGYVGLGYQALYEIFNSGSLFQFKSTGKYAGLSCLRLLSCLEL